MNLKDQNIDDLVGEKKVIEIVPEDTIKKEKSEEKIGGSMIGDLAGTAMAAMPFVPFKYKVLASAGAFIIIYGVVSLVLDIINLLK